MNNPSKCPVCRGERKKQVAWFTCEICGRYSVTPRALLCLTGKMKPELSSNLRALLSHQLRTQQNQDVPPRITPCWLKDLKENGKLPSPRVQAAKIMGDEESETGDAINVPIEFHAVIGSHSRDAAVGLLDELRAKGLVKGSRDDGYRLTLEGWDQYKEET